MVCLVVVNCSAQYFKNNRQAVSTFCRHNPKGKSDSHAKRQARRNATEAPRLDLDFPDLAIFLVSMHDQSVFFSTGGDNSRVFSYWILSGCLYACLFVPLSRTQNSSYPFRDRLRVASSRAFCPTTIADIIQFCIGVAPAYLLTYCCIC